MQKPMSFARYLKVDELADKSDYGCFSERS